MRKLTTEQFKEKAINIHGNKYSYEEVEYKDTYTDVKIWCKKCKDYFYQRPNNHISGKAECIRCSYTKRNKYKISNKEKLIEFILKKYPENKELFNYDNLIYTHCRKKVEILCVTHGAFLITPTQHLLHGKGCPKCRGRNKKTSDFVSEILTKFPKNKEVYNYQNVKYTGSKNKIEIICIVHGSFFQTPHHHLEGSGCPSCKNSKGENKIENILIKKNIKYVPQKRFLECKNKNPLPFDFYLPEHNICIEYQGEQHYLPISALKKKKFTKEESSEYYLKRQKHDEIKRNYCKSNNITLLEIPYWDFNNIEEILTQTLNDV